MSGTLSRPRLQLLVNGIAIPALSAEVNSNNYYHADSFKSSLWLNDPALTNVSLGNAFWCANPTGGTNAPVMVTVQIDPGLTAQPNWVGLITGRVDNIEFDPITGQLDIDGRDLTSLFIEARTFETFKNQTSSQVATTLAGRHGLTANVAATTALVDRYYSQDHDKISLNDFSRVTTEWDLLTFLAQEEGFNVWVSNNTLNFQPQTPPAANPYVVNLTLGAGWFTANATSIKVRRALSLARDIQVTVQTWSSKARSGFKVTAKATGTKAASAAAVAKPGGSTTQNYVFTRPNLTHDQAQKLANQKLAELSAHERVVTVEMPGECVLTARQGLRLAGTGTDCDQDYYITEISRTINHEEFRQTVTAKNQSPKDTTLVG